MKEPPTIFLKTMKRPNILNKVYEALSFREQELFRKKLVAIGLNPRVFHENYKLNSCKINVMDLYDLMVEIVASDRQFEHPYFVLQEWLRKKTRQVPSPIKPSFEPAKMTRQIELEQVIKEVKDEKRERYIDLSEHIEKKILMGTTLQIFILKDGRELRLDPRREYHYKEYNGGYTLVAPTGI